LFTAFRTGVQIAPGEPRRRDFSEAPSGPGSEFDPLAGASGNEKRALR
jgi:hypothetical protein